MKSSIGPRRLSLRRQGAVLVEFAIVVPVAFLLFLGFLEVSRVLLLQHSIDTAAYEGARNAMVPGATADEAIGSAEQLCRSAGLRGYQVEVDPPVLNENTAFITVKVYLPVDRNAVGGSLYFSSKTLVSSVTLMCERPPMVKLTGIPVLQQIVDEYNPPEPEPEPEEPPPSTPEPPTQPEPEGPVTETPGPEPEPEPEPQPPTPPAPEPPPPTPPSTLPVYRY